MSERDAAPGMHHYYNAKKANNEVNFSKESKQWRKPSYFARCVSVLSPYILFTICIYPEQFVANLEVILMMNSLSGCCKER